MIQEEKKANSNKLWSRLRSRALLATVTGNANAIVIIVLSLLLCNQRTINAYLYIHMLLNVAATTTIYNEYT